MECQIGIGTAFRWHPEQSDTLRTPSIEFQKNSFHLILIWWKCRDISEPESSINHLNSVEFESVDLVGDCQCLISWRLPSWNVFMASFLWSVSIAGSNLPAEISGIESDVGWDLIQSGTDLRLAESVLLSSHLLASCWLLRRRSSNQPTHRSVSG